MDTQPIKEFQRFLQKELEPAVDELDGIDDASRKHIQKLMYTNLVDRFDSLVDHLLLSSCRTESLVEEAFKGLTQPVTESQLLELLLKGDDLQSALTNRLKDALRLGVLRKRHSKKLAKLFEVFDITGNMTQKPRVNPSTGHIMESFTVQYKQTPHSICGYADWLYSRRNTIVHGSGKSSYLQNDRDQIKKLYKVTVKQGIKLSLSSIKTAVAFYRDICNMFLSE